jgi:hypothetical protein
MDEIEPKIKFDDWNDHLYSSRMKLSLKVEFMDQNKTVVLKV